MRRPDRPFYLSPVRFSFALGDDRALFDNYGVSTSGPRNGMLVGQHIQDEIFNDPRTARFNQLWVDYALCNPFRTTFCCGQTRLHHDNENDEPGFYHKWVKGDYGDVTLYGRPNQFNGPLLQDLAQQFAHQNSQSYDQTYLPQSHWMFPPGAPSSQYVGVAAANQRNGVAYGPGNTFNSGMTGQTITAVGTTGIPAGTTVTYNSPGQVTMSQAATASHTGTVVIGGVICAGTKITSGSKIVTSFCAQGVIGLGNSVDHLQAFSGSLMTWLPCAGVDRIAIIGKLANCYGAQTSAPWTETATANGPGYGTLTDEYVPAGVTDACIIVGDSGNSGDIQDHWHMALVEYHGDHTTNPSWGVGATGTRYVYRYNHRIDNIAYDPVAHQLVVTLDGGSDVHGPCDGPCGLYAHELALVLPGEEVAITGVTGTAAPFYNNNQWIIASVTATQIRISHDVNNVAVTNHGTAPGGANVQASPRSLFSEWVLHKKAIAFYDSVKDNESFFAYLPARMCHAEVAGVATHITDTSGATTTSFEEEIRYVGTVDGTLQTVCWAGVNGAMSPAHDSGDLPFSGIPMGIWNRRREMDCTFDDTVYAKLQYLDRRWGRYGHDFAVGTDNGWQQLAQNAVEGAGNSTGARVGAKGYNYADSLICPVYWRAGIEPWAMTGDIPFMVGCHELAPTVIRLFSRKFPILKHHHINITGDGDCIQDKMHDYAAGLFDSPRLNVAFLTIGQWHNGSLGVQGGSNNAHVAAIQSSDFYRYIVSILNPLDTALWDMNDVPIRSITWSAASGGTATVVTTRAHGRTTGDRVWLVCDPAVYNVLGSTYAGYSDGGGGRPDARVTVIDSVTYTVPMANPSAAFRSGKQMNRWETENLVTGTVGNPAQPGRVSAMAVRLTAAQAAGFDVTTRRSALVTTGSGSSRLDVDGNAAPVGNGNTTRTV